MRRILTLLMAIMLAFVPIGVGLTEETPATPTDIDDTIPIVETIEQTEKVPDEQIVVEAQQEENTENEPQIEQEPEIETEEILESESESVEDAVETLPVEPAEEIIEEPMEEIIEEPIEEVIEDPAEEIIEEPVVRTIKLHASWENQEHIYAGDEITLWFETEGFDDIYYTIQWEYSENGTDFSTIENANDQTYKFVIDEVNCNYYWRVKLVIIE